MHPYMFFSQSQVKIQGCCSSQLKSIIEKYMLDSNIHLMTEEKRILTVGSERRIKYEYKRKKLRLSSKHKTKTSSYFCDYKPQALSCGTIYISKRMLCPKCLRNWLTSLSPLLRLSVISTQSLCSNFLLFFPTLHSPCALSSSFPTTVFCLHTTLCRPYLSVYPRFRHHSYLHLHLFAASPFSPSHPPFPPLPPSNTSPHPICTMANIELLLWCYSFLLLLPFLFSPLFQEKHRRFFFCLNSACCGIAPRYHSVNLSSSLSLSLFSFTLALPATLACNIQSESPYLGLTRGIVSSLSSHSMGFSEE